MSSPNVWQSQHVRIQASQSTDLRALQVARQGHARDECLEVAEVLRGQNLSGRHDRGLTPCGWKPTLFSEQLCH